MWLFKIHLCWFQDANEPVGPEYSAAAYPPQPTKDVVSHEPATAFPGPLVGVIKKVSKVQGTTTPYRGVMGSQGGPKIKRFYH